MQFTKILCCSLFLAALGASACHTDASMPAQDGAARSTGMHALDGKRFEVRLIEQGATKGESDTLEFDSGRFHSTACDAYGFSASPYTTQMIDGVLTFRASCTNSAGDRNDWHGTLRGERIEGAFTWTPVKGEPVERSYAGAQLR